MSGAPPPHPPAEPERWRPPDAGSLARGLALGVLALGSVVAGVRLSRASLALAPASALAAAVAGLAAWGAAIVLTGGVKHDDHPWV